MLGKFFSKYQNPQLGAKVGHSARQRGRAPRIAHGCSSHPFHSLVAASLLVLTLHEVEKSNGFILYVSSTTAKRGLRRANNRRGRDAKGMSRDKTKLRRDDANQPRSSTCKSKMRHIKCWRGAAHVLAGGVQHNQRPRPLCHESHGHVNHTVCSYKPCARVSAWLNVLRVGTNLIHH